MPDTAHAAPSIADEEAALMAALLEGRIALAEHARQQGLLNLRRLFEATGLPVYALQALAFALPPRAPEGAPIPGWLAAYLSSVGDAFDDLANHRGDFARPDSKPQPWGAPPLRRKVTPQDVFAALAFPKGATGVRFVSMSRQLATDWRDMEAARGLGAPAAVEDQSTLRKRAGRARRKAG